ncbi:MAG: tRNA (adenosine(37)-N6)-dimethylallyltransferase MiaA [Ignavibacteriales bacterium]|nr:tRNA (adenosine(37)-N6)-dimethylallyltransferase MiaA [Ignavibacteriales bacterium]
MPSLPHILVIVGPTASGKTSLALEISRHIPSEIISADSRQVYKHLDIGTAKPTKSEMAEVAHHCIDIREPDQTFNAGDFQVLGRKLISEILGREKLPIVCGGTGLYVQAVIDGFFEQPEFSGTIRAEFETRMEREGKESLHRELMKIDPASAKTMDATKYRRVIRALEVFYETGIPISQFHANHKKDELYNATWVGLNWERPALYKRINDRVDQMISNGFVDEVQRLQSMGYDDRFQSLQTVGYKEAFQFLRNEISHDRMIELMKQNTRRFAKRQMTWFRKESRIKWFDVHSGDKLNDISRLIIKKFKS